MDKKVLEMICKTVYEQYPLLKGVIPELKPQPNGNQILVFQYNQNLTEQKNIPIQVRVVVDQNGKITKVSSSR